MNLRLLSVLFLALVTSVQAASLDSGTSPPSALKPSQQQLQAAHLAAELMTRNHYKAMPLDDAMSEKIFDHYLKALDPEKVFFVQSDIDQLAGIRTKLGDAIVKEDLGIPFGLFNLYAQRVAERFAYARSLLQEGFDFRRMESYQYERAKENWPKSELEMHELWRKRVKNDWLRLKIVGQDDKKIAETLDKRYGHFLKRISQVKSEDAFETFMNAYTTAMDPHTNYLGPRAAQEFDISMGLSLVGIGATVTVAVEKDDYATIRELVPGGPAMLSGKLKVGDRIVGIAQGEHGVMTDIVGWRPDDMVALIRGPEDSCVVLDVLPAGSGPDGKHKLVSLVRKKINLNEQAAKKSVLSAMDGKTIRHVGVISLPSFYHDFEAQQQGDQDFKSVTRDVIRLLDELKNDGVDGVLIDLRNNGGGSMMEAIELTGLFIGNKPVMQERDAVGNVTVKSATKVDVTWDGPLAVLIDRNSASASEIFAAAIQDHGRGLVIGEPSFGKGTAQVMINLDQVAHNDKPQFGDLRLTVVQFFRINGGTTQRRGVTPDISLPEMADAERFSESSFDNALPWMEVKAADYSPAEDLIGILPVLLKRHQARVKDDKDLRDLQQDIAEFNRKPKKDLVSLNEAELRKERDIQEVWRDIAESAHEKHVGQQSTLAKNRAVHDDGLQAEERDVVNELAAEKQGKKRPDVLLNEAVHILIDEASLLKPGAKFASTVKAEPNAIAAETMTQDKRSCATNSTQPTTQRAPREKC